MIRDRRRLVCVCSSGVVLRMNSLQLEICLPCFGVSFLGPAIFRSLVRFFVRSGVFFPSSDHGYGMDPSVRLVACMSADDGICNSSLSFLHPFSSTGRTSQPSVATLSESVGTGHDDRRRTSVTRLLAPGIAHDIPGLWRWTLAASIGGHSGVLVGPLAEGFATGLDWRNAMPDPCPGLLPSAG